MVEVMLQCKHAKLRADYYGRERLRILAEIKSVRDSASVEHLHAMHACAASALELMRFWEGAHAPRGIVAPAYMRED